MCRRCSVESEKVVKFRGIRVDWLSMSSVYMASQS